MGEWLRKNRGPGEGFGSCACMERACIWGSGLPSVGPGAEGCPAWRPLQLHRSMLHLVCSEWEACNLGSGLPSLGPGSDGPLQLHEIRPDPLGTACPGACLHGG